MRSAEHNGDRRAEHPELRGRVEKAVGVHEDHDPQSECRDDRALRPDTARDPADHQRPADARLVGAAPAVVMPIAPARKTRTRAAASRTPPPREPSAQPSDDTNPRRSGLAMSERNALKNTTKRKSTRLNSGHFS